MATLFVLSDMSKVKILRLAQYQQHIRKGSDPSANVSLEEKAGTEMKAVLPCLCGSSGAFFFFFFILGF